MNYELAKELKDAGFPQKEKGTLLFKEGIRLTDTQEYWNENSAYAPTLSELIEACGDGFIQLERLPDRWMCYFINDRGWTEGKTPEEAVARLWLALNKK